MMRRYVLPTLVLILLALLLATPSQAAISTVAASCNGTSSCTTTGNATGDFELAWACRDGSATVPTTATGWTSIGTQAINGTGAADSACKIACKVATGANEASNTFTNATSLTILVFSGQAGGNTTGCGTSIAGTPSFFATTINTTSTTETFNTLATRSADGWVAGFGYAPAATAGMTTAPTGMTNRNSQGTVMGAHDTNGPTASYSTANVTITTASRIITVVVEIRFGPWTCKQGATGCTDVSARQCTAAGTTCNITSASTASGSVSILCMHEGGNTTANFSSSSAGGFTFPASAKTQTNGSTTGCGYNLNTTGGVTTITCTSSAGADTQCMFFEFTTTLPTITFDVGGTTNSASCTNCAGPALSLATANYYIFGGVAGFQNAGVSINQNWIGYVTTNSNFTAAKWNYADYGTTPNWTQSGAGTANVSSLAIYAAASTNTPTQVGAFSVGP